MEYKNLKLSDIHPLDNIRDKIDKAGIKELARSIKENGLIHPITVRKNAKGYELIAGNRRYMAFETNKEKEIPAMIVEAGDDEVRQIQLIENIQRQDLNLIEESNAIDLMLQDRNCTVKDAALILGKTERYVLEHRQLNKLIKPLQKDLLDGSLKIGMAFRMARLEPEIQKKIESNYSSVEYYESNKFLDLKEAPFKTNDKELDPVMGACTECKFNTGTKKELFGDVGKADLCTDDKCFENKCNLFVIQRIKAMTDSGEDFIKITTHYVSDSKGVQSIEDYVKYSPQIHKKLEPLKALVVEGEYKNLGKVLKVISKKKTTVNSKGEIEKIETSEPKQDPDERYWRKIDLITFPETEKLVRETIKELLLPAGLNKPIVDMVDVMFENFLEVLEHNARDRFIYFAGIKTTDYDTIKHVVKYAKDFTANQKLNLMLLISLIGQINYGQVEFLAKSPSIKDLLKIAKDHFGWNVDEYKKTISKEYDEKRLKQHTRFIERFGREPKKK